MPAVALAGAIVAGVAHADDAALDALQKKVDVLEGNVRELKDRIRALEQGEAACPVPASTTSGSPDTAPARTTVAKADQAVAPPQPAVPATEPSVDDQVVALRRSWRRIAAGMPQADVRSALGPPSHEMRINGKVVWYYYYAGLGAGSVFFNADGRISSSQSPNLGWGF